MGDVERQAARRDREVAIERLLAAVGDHQREVEQRAVGEAGEARRPSRGGTRPSAARWRSPGPPPPRPGQPPARHLPRGPRPLPEPEVGDQPRRAHRPRTPAPRRAAKPAISAMSVVGTTFGIGEKATRPATADRGERRDQGDDLGRRARALVPGEAAKQDSAEERPSLASQLIRCPPPAGVPRRRLARGSTLSTAIRLIDRDGGAVEDARHLAREVPAAGQQLRRPCRRRPPRRVRAAPPARRRWRRTRRRGWRSSPRPRDRESSALELGQLLPCEPGPCPGSARPGSSAPGSRRRPCAARDHDRESQALALAAGEIARIRVDLSVEAEASQRAGPVIAAQLIADALVNEEVARPLREQGDLTPGVDPAALRLDQARRRPEQGALARPLRPISATRSPAAIRARRR